MSIKSSFVFSFLVYFIFTLINGTNGKPPVRIVGGTIATIDEFPAVVSIRVQGQHICGGSLITRMHVLTAAHCMVKEDRYTKNITEFSLWALSIGSGSNNCKNPTNVHNVKQLAVHPNYKGSSTAYVNDIGVITLTKPIVVDPRSQFPIQLPTDYSGVGVPAVVAGWGSSSASEQKTSTLLQKISANTISNFDCRHRVRNTVDNGQLCAFHRKGVGFCNGDSGGPLIHNKTVIGVVSLSYGCGAGYPDVYTRVSPYVSWIKQKIQV